MLPFFPSPYPDELLYSIIARYQLRLGSSSARVTAGAVFGSPTAGAVVDLPTRLNDLYLNLPHGSMNTPVKIISDNTLFPYYRRFLSSRRAASIADMMCSSSGNSVQLSIGIPASSIPPLRRMRFCTKCVEDDEKLYGESYWHRSHQVSGVIRCYLHKRWLTESVLSNPSSGSRRTFYALDEIYPRGGSSLVNSIDSLSWDDIALSSFWLLNSHSEQIHVSDTLRKRYLWWLWKKQITPNPFTLKIRNICEKLYAYYGDEFLRQLHCHFLPSDDYNWVTSLLRKQRKMIHPLHHILFIHFLGITPELFFQVEEQPYQPFGRGPWPCLNPVALHFGERVISACECTHVNERKEPVGVFRCNCGYTYGRAKHVKGGDDCFEKEWVVSFGHIWEEELCRHVNQAGLSLRETARKLGVDVNTVRFQLKRLSDLNQVITGLTVEDSIKGDECTLRRDRWLRLIKQFPGESRKDLRERAKSDYAWLYRNDQEWLFDHQPETVSYSRSRDRIDWQKRDSELAAQIPAAVEIIKGRGRPQRITIAAIGNQLGRRSLLEKMRYKLPKTAAELYTQVDTDTSFAIRRLAYVIKEMQTKNLPLVAWKILRTAAMRDSPVVQEALLRLITEQ